MKTLCKSDIGLVRATNQDACQCGTFLDGAVWALVCDGMGGANGGNIASRTALTEMETQLQERYNPAEDEKGIQNLLLSCIYSANEKVFSMAQNQPELRGMGTTVVGAVVRKNRACIVHVGDSRAYSFSKGNLQRLTTDHSVVQELIDRGDITEEEARNHPHKNVITRAVGVQDMVDVDVSFLDLPEDSTLLFCTDGLTNFVREEEISECLSQYSGETLLDLLIEKALAGGGGDNVTVALIENGGERSNG
mgnify:FL=1